MLLRLRPSQRVAFLLSSSSLFYKGWWTSYTYSDGNKVYSYEVIAESLQYDLFKKYMSNTHCLNHLYQAKSYDSHKLRPRGHN